MNYPIYITHELIMETTKFYVPEEIKYAEKDFDRIDSIRKTALGNFIAVSGLVHHTDIKLLEKAFIVDSMMLLINIFILNII